MADWDPFSDPADGPVEEVFFFSLISSDADDSMSCVFLIKLISVWRRGGEVGGLSFYFKVRSM